MCGMICRDTRDLRGPSTARSSQGPRRKQMLDGGKIGQSRAVRVISVAAARVGHAPANLNALARNLSRRLFWHLADLLFHYHGLGGRQPQFGAP